MTATSEQLEKEQQQRQKAEQSLDKTQTELTATSEQLSLEQQQRQKAEQSLDKTQSELTALSEQYRNEQEQRLKLEQSLSETKDKLNSPPSEDSSEHAEQLQPTKAYSVKSLGNGKVLTIPRGTSKNNTPISQDTWHGGRNQQWRFQPLGGVDQGYYHIFSVKTNKCLDVPLNSMENDAEIHQYLCYGSDKQKWQLIPALEGSFVIQCKQSSLVLAAASGKTGKIVQYTQRNSNSQRWILTEI